MNVALGPGKANRYLSIIHVKISDGLRTEIIVTTERIPTTGLKVFAVTRSETKFLLYQNDAPRIESWACKANHHCDCYGLAKNKTAHKFVRCSCSCHLKEARRFCRQCGKWLVGPYLCIIHGMDIFEPGESNLLTDATDSV